MSSINNILGNPKFVNTRYFREAAIDYERNGGRYTLAPRGSKEWRDYWMEQEKRCLLGYKVGGVKITGRHYFYLNFTRMSRTREEDKGKKVGKKEKFFPLFFEIDYDWFWYKEIAWYGVEKKVIDKLHLWRNPTPNPDGTYGGAMHLGCLKVRRGGFSYKEAADGVYNYNFYPASKSYYFSGNEQFLTSDGILNKVQDNLEFLNQHTDGFWYKNRMESNTLMHQKASYIDKAGNKKGYQSEIIGVTVKHDPNVVRGKDGMKAVYEEGGSFKNLKAAMQITVPSMKEGATLTGQISVFGTGGEEKGPHIEGLEDIFNEPRSFDMLPFENDWEEGYEGTECGIFIPCYMANPSFMDNDGNVLKKEALDYEDKLREIKKASRDHKNFDRHIAEFPKYPTEALLRTSNTNMPKADILLQKNRILKNKEIMGRMLHGWMVNEGGKGVTFQIDPDAKPILKYPHKNDDDITGCVTIVEPPQRCDVKIIKDGGAKFVNKIPDDVYYLIFDPYYKDEPKGPIDTLSLGAAYVVKTTSTYFSNQTDIDVAWIVGRPGNTKTFIKQMFMLAEYYNAKIQGEIAGGGQAVVDYARENKKLDMLMYDAIYINEKEIEKISKNRSYLMDLPTEKKALGLTYLIDGLTTPIGIDENGSEIWKLHYICDIGYLDELLKYNGTGNFDRISAHIVKELTIKERIQEVIRGKKRRRDVLGGRTLFGGNTSNRELSLFDANGKMLD